MDAKPPLIPIEVLPPDPHGEPFAARPAGDTSIPFHPLAVTLMIVVDSLWNLADWAVVGWMLTIPLSFMTVFWPALFIQRLVRRDGWGAAFAKALFLGVVAAVPTSVTGTPIGLALLAWAGIRKLQR
jgi:hypothetical protein